MLVADVFGWVFFFLGLLISLPALWLLYGALWPKALGRAEERLRRMPIRTFLAGLGTIGLFTLATGALAGANAGPLALVVGTFGFGWALFGVSAFARAIGSRLPSTLEIPWRAHLRGAIVLELAFLFPLVGWVLALPITIALGAGAATLSLFSRRQQETPPSVPAVSEKERAEVMA